MKIPLIDGGDELGAWLYGVWCGIFLCWLLTIIFS